ncbi:heme-copper oxidase family protein [Saccharibacter floricola]|uniref:hypothetical protein n=1 Tax=Saccharibacter floricola TaxID=231053 RepID=UPI0003715733|nr:hypothetical protein [Saccharibacter floricola]
MTVDQSNSSIFPSKTAVLGGSFLLLALFSGILGGALALPVFRTSPTEGMVVAHAVLMTFFVMCPAVLGGVACCSLPKLLGGDRMMLPTASVIGWGLLACGVLSLPVSPAIGLALWALGIGGVAMDVIATVLEGRQVRFRELAPLAWSLLALSMALIVVVPVLLALLVKGVAPITVVEKLRVPEMSMMLIPALGIVAQTLFGGAASRHGLTHRVAPYAFIVMGLVGPLLWADALFGGVPGYYETLALIVGQVVPGGSILFALCRDSWSHSLRYRASVLWSLGAVALLAVGWGVALFPELMAGHGMGEEFGHQAAVFGALLALSGAFYAWFARDRAVGSLWYEGAGSVHALLTFAGALCTLVPQWEELAVALMTASLVGYFYLGMAAWKRVLQNYMRAASSVVVKRG